MAPKLLVIVGATGNQGSAIARLYAQKPDWRVRGLTRDPTRPSNAWLRELGVDLVKADLDDPASLDAAFAGAHTIFGVTDFWQFWAEARAQELAARDGVPMNVACMRREVAQGRNIADAAARVGALEAFVWSTLSDTIRWSGGEVTENYHFDGKVVVEKYIRDELPALAAKTRYLMVGFYATNWKNMGPFGPQKQPDGTWVYTGLTVPGCPPARMPVVLPPRDTGVYVEGLLAAPPGTTLLAFTEYRTMAEIAATWSRITGQVCNVEYTTPEQVLAADDGPLTREIVATSIYTTKFGYAGKAPELKHPQDIGIDVRRLTTLEQYMREEDWAPLLESGGHGSVFAAADKAA